MDLVHTVTFFDGIQEVTYQAWRSRSFGYFIIWADYGEPELQRVTKNGKSFFSFSEMAKIMIEVEQ